MLSMTAAALYLVVSALCLLAAIHAHRRERGPRSRAIWLVIALLFALLAASRLLHLEDNFRQAARLWLAARGEYGARRAIQGPLAALILALGGLAGIALFIGLGRSRRGLLAPPTKWAARAAAAMLGLVALRMVSLHSVDALLYRPLHLNWLLDIGATVFVAGCAWAYRRSPRPGEDRWQRR